MRFSVFTVVSLATLAAASPIAHGTPEITEREPAIAVDVSSANAPRVVNERAMPAVTSTQVNSAQFFQNLSASGKIAGTTINLGNLGGFLGGLFNFGKKIISTTQADAISSVENLLSGGKMPTGATNLTSTEYNQLQIVEALFKSITGSLF